MFAKLPSEALEKARTLPVKPDSVILRGQKVSLVPAVAAQDGKVLFEASNGSPLSVGEKDVEAYDPEERIWRFLFEGPYDSQQEFETGLQKWIDSPNGLCFAVHHNEAARPVGVVNYMRNHPEHLRIELGGIWYTPGVQRTGVNTESVYLLLRHAFDVGYRRVEWKCHSEHVRSRNAALRLGFSYECTQEAHMIWKGSSRDTAWFRMLDSEWPAVRTSLEEKMAG